MVQTFTPRQVRTLDIYLSQIRHSPTLDETQVRSYVLRYQTQGDVQARNQVVTSILPYGVHVAKLYQTNGVELQDLIQEASLGIIEAMEHYDTQRDIPFILYAGLWMRKYICSFLTRYRTTITPAHHAAQLPSVSSLDVPITDSEDEYTMAEQLESEDAYEIAQAIDEEQIGYAIHLALDTLDETESEVLRLSYGIGCHPESDDTIAQLMGLRSTNRVQEIRELAQQNLAGRLRYTTHQ